MRGAYGLLVTALDLTRSTTTFASSSTINLWIPAFKASFNPSLKAQNSAIMLVAKPMDLANPLNQLPLQSLISPPPPAQPRFPQEAPSVFNLYHPSGGLDHFTWIMDLLFTCLTLPTQKKNSTA